MVFVDLVIRVIVESMGSELISRKCVCGQGSGKAYQFVPELLVVFLLVATTTVLLVKIQTNCHRFVSLGEEYDWFCPHVKKQQPVVINTGLVADIKSFFKYSVVEFKSSLPLL